MKTILFTFLSLIFFLTSCSGFLDLNPISNSNEESFYENETDFNNAIVGAYSILKAKGVFQGDVQLIGDLRSDNTEMGTTASNRFDYYNLSRFELQTTNKISENVWSDHYNGILRVNKIIDKIEKFESSKSFKNRILSEAKFLRAVLYFNLVRIFGDIPLIINNISSIEEAYKIGRTNVSEVYNQIIIDFREASEFLPNQVQGEEGRATKGAALALLAKVYLTTQDFSNAKKALEDVIAMNQYKLSPIYSDLWKVENKNNDEIIFAVQFQRSATANTGSNFCERFTPYLYPYLSYYSTGGGYNIPRENLIAAYEPNDLRKEASLRESYESPDGETVTGLQGRFCIKFFDTPVEGEGSNDNWPVIRYSDVVLMYAEVLNELSYNPNGLAFEYLNKIRRRAGIPDKSSGGTNQDLVINSQEEFREAVLKERRIEFAFEGHRWFDLIRTEKATDLINKNLDINITKDQYLLPIPQNEIDINPDKIKQNPGY